MHRTLPIALLLAALLVYALLIQQVWDNRAEVRAAIPAGYIIPSKFSRILAVGYQGLLSDYLFLKTATFVGGRSTSGLQLNAEDWDYVSSSLDVVTDLDPYFVDPYVLAEGLLAWDAGMPEVANQLLAKGMEYRQRDWRLPFYIGFNQFYFLRDYELAADYIMQAARLPGSPAYLPNLGARLAYYGGKSKTALLFLREMLTETDDALLKQRLQIRLLALQGAVVIEDALERFRNEQERFPESLNELLEAGYLPGLPPEPYGGDWIFNDRGQVFSTSRFAHSYRRQAEGRAVPAKP